MSNRFNDNYKVEILHSYDNMKISFEYMTKNNEYNLNYFNKSKDLKNKSEFLTFLFNEIQDLTSKTFGYFMGKDRTKIGFEKIKIINFAPNTKISRDEKIYSKRLKNKYRIIFIFRNNTIYVIGFDFNYSAYKH